MDSPDLLCSAPLLIAELRGWLHALEAYQGHNQSVNSESSSVTSTPLSLPPPVSSCVCCLATMCAEMAVYSSAENYNDHVSDPETTPFYMACDAVTPTSESQDSSIHITASVGLNSPTSKTYGATTSTYQPCDQTTPTSTLCDSLDVYINRYFDYLDLARLLRLLSQHNWDVRRNCWKVLAVKIAVSHTSGGSHSCSVSGLSERELLSTLKQ